MRYDDDGQKDDKVWRNPDHLIEIYKSELDGYMSVSFWQGVLTGLTFTVIVGGFSMIYYLTH